MKDVGILLQKCDVGTVLSELGIRYERRSSKRGYELYFKCFTGKHEDDPGKLRMSVAEIGRYKGFFNCWACGTSGNLVHLLRHLGGLSFAEAVAHLEGRWGSALVTGVEGLQFRLRMHKECDEEDGPLKSIEPPYQYRPLNQCASKGADIVREWLRSERHIDQRGIERFEISYSEHPTLGPCVAIPIYFDDMLVSIFYAQPFKGGIKRYPKDSPQGRVFFNHDACLEKGGYIMMESILDVIKLWCVTGAHAMACFTNMISETQLRLLREFDEHGVMPDLDGQRGWDLVTRMVPVTGKSTWLYFIPVGKDPGDCTPAELKDAISRRVRYCNYESEQLIAQRQEVRHTVTQIKKP